MSNSIYTEPVDRTRTAVSSIQGRIQNRFRGGAPNSIRVSSATQMASRNLLASLASSLLQAWLNAEKCASLLMETRSLCLSPSQSVRSITTYTAKCCPVGKNNYHRITITSGGMHQCKSRSLAVVPPPTPQCAQLREGSRTARPRRTELGSRLAPGEMDELSRWPWLSPQKHCC